MYIILCAVFCVYIRNRTTDKILQKHLHTHNTAWQILQYSICYVVFCLETSVLQYSVCRFVQYFVCSVLCVAFAMQYFVWTQVRSNNKSISPVFCSLSKGGFWLWQATTKDRHVLLNATNAKTLTWHFHFRCFNAFVNHRYFLSGADKYTDAKVPMRKANNWDKSNNCNQCEYASPRIWKLYSQVAWSEIDGRTSFAISLVVQSLSEPC